MIILSGSCDPENGIGVRSVLTPQVAGRVATEWPATVDQPDVIDGCRGCQSLDVRSRRLETRCETVSRRTDVPAIKRASATGTLRGSGALMPDACRWSRWAAVTGGDRWITDPALWDSLASTVRTLKRCRTVM
jgi:hypothetical protein